MGIWNKPDESKNRTMARFPLKEAEREALEAVYAYEKVHSYWSSQ